MKTNFLVKLGPQLKLLSSADFDSFSPNELLALGLACAEEQRSCLLSDALKGDRLYYGRKVAEELEKSLQKIEEKIPEIRKQIDKLVFGERAIN